MDPIRVSVVFDAQGNTSLQRGADSLERLERMIGRLGGTAASSGRLLRSLQHDMDRFTESAIRARRVGLDGFNIAVDKATGVLTRFARVGVYAAIGQITALAFALKKLGQEFIQINEEFSSLEITMRSAFKSSSIAGAIRGELARITATSPIPFKDLAESVRAASLIRPFKNQIAQQSASGTLRSADGFLRQYIGLIEKMIAFRPDKNADDATYAIREASAGEFRSLARRFDIPPSLMVQASGRSLPFLRRNANNSFDAMNKMFSDIISPQAIREITQQPTVLFANLMEQLIDLPLLKTGEAGFYNHFLKFFQGIFKKATDFVNANGDKYGKAFSESLTRLFDSTTSSVGKIYDKLLSFVGQSKADRPGVDVMERSFAAVSTILDEASVRIPAALDLLSDGFERFGKPFLDLITRIKDVIISVAKQLIESPVLTSLKLFSLQFIPSLLKATASQLSSVAVTGAQNARSAFYNNLLAGNTAGASMAAPGMRGGGAAVTGALPYIPMQTSSPIGRFGRFATAASSAIVAANINNLRGNIASLNMAGYTPINGTPYYIGPNGQRVSAFGAPNGSVNGVGGLAPVTGPVPGTINTSALASYGMQMASNGRVMWAAGNPNGMQGFVANNMIPIGARFANIGGGTIGAARSILPVGAGFTPLAAGATAASFGAGSAALAGVGSVMTSVILPALAAAGAVAIISSIAERVSSALETRRKRLTIKAGKEAGYTEDEAKLTSAASASFTDLLERYQDEVNNGRLSEMKFKYDRLNPSIDRGLKAYNYFSGTSVNIPRSLSIGKVPTTATAKELSLYAATLVDDIERLNKAMLAGEDVSNFKLGIAPDFKIETPEDGKNLIKQLSKAYSDVINPAYKALRGLGMTARVINSEADSQAISDLKQFVDDINDGAGWVSDQGNFGFAKTVGALNSWFNLFNVAREKMSLASQGMDANAKSAASDAIEELRREMDSSASRYSGLTEEKAWQSEVERLKELKITADAFEQLRSDILNGKLTDADVANQNTFLKKSQAILEAMLRGDKGEEAQKIAEEASKLSFTDRMRVAAETGRKEAMGRIGMSLADNMEDFFANAYQQAVREVSSATSKPTAQEALVKFETRIQELSAIAGQTEDTLMQDVVSRIEALLTGLKDAVASTDFGKMASNGNQRGSAIQFTSALKSLFGGFSSVFDTLPQKPEDIAEKGLAVYGGAIKAGVLSSRKANLVIDAASNASLDAGYTEAVQRYLAQLRLAQSGTDSVHQFRQVAGSAGLSSVNAALALSQQERSAIGLTGASRVSSLVSRGTDFGRMTTQSLEIRKAALADLSDMQERYNELLKTEANEDKRLEYSNRAQQLRELAASMELLNREVVGAGDAWSSFKEGFTSVMDDFAARAKNFTDIGRNMAESFSNGLGTAASNAALGLESASKAFANFGKSILQTATQLMLQKAVQMLLGSIFGIGGAIATPATGAFTSAATGNTISMSSGISPSFGYSLGGHYKGGILPGNDIGRDNLLIKAASGEAVIPASTVRKFGPSHFEPYFRGELPSTLKGFYNGGIVHNATPTTGTSAVAGGVNVTVNVNVDKNSNVSTTMQSEDGAEAFGNNLAAFVQAEILRSNRQGGMNRRRR